MTARAHALLVAALALGCAPEVGGEYRSDPGIVVSGACRGTETWPVIPAYPETWTLSETGENAVISRNRADGSGPPPCFRFDAAVDGTSGTIRPASCEPVQVAPGLRVAVDWLGGTMDFTTRTITGPATATGIPLTCDLMELHFALVFSALRTTTSGSAACAGNVTGTLWRVSTPGGCPWW